jgi:type II secretory pathway component PulJ
MTLLELMVALVVGLLVIASARVLLGAVSESSVRYRALLDNDARLHALDAVARAVRAAQPAASNDEPLLGTSTTAIFTTRLRSLEFGSSRQALALRLESLASDSAALLMQVDDTVLQRVPVPADAELRYVQFVSGERIWRSQWAGMRVLPHAIALLSGRDTLVFGTVP